MMDILEAIENSEIKRRKGPGTLEYESIPHSSPPTTLMNKLNIAYVPFQSYLKYMTKKKLIKTIPYTKQREILGITPFGKEILSLFREIKKLLELE